MVATLGGGEMIELNKIYNEDCLEGMKRIPDKSVDLIVTDPPYEHVKGGMKSKKYNVGTWKAESYMNEKMSDFKKEDIFNFLNISIKKMKKVNMYIFCSKLQLAHYFDYINQNKKLKYDLLVWDKSSVDNKYSMKSSKFFTQDIEYIIRIYESGVSLNKIWNEEGTKSDSKYYMKRQKFQQPKGKHNTMKPIKLIERFIKLSSNENDVVLDMFMGSGTTAIACINTNRNYIGFEMDKEFYNISQERIKEHMKDNLRVLLEEKKNEK